MERSKVLDTKLNRTIIMASETQNVTHYSSGCDSLLVGVASLEKLNRRGEKSLRKGYLGTNLSPLSQSKASPYMIP